MGSSWGEGSTLHIWGGLMLETEEQPQLQQQIHPQPKSKMGAENVTQGSVEWLAPMRKAPGLVSIAAK